MKLRQVILLVYALILGACTSINVRDNASLPAVALTKLTELELRYTGKGAAAGPMLMSTMGASGIAVGMAIDVGIGKDINSALVDSGVSITESFKRSVVNELERTCISKESQTNDWSKFCAAQSIFIEFDQIKFKGLPGSDDPTQLIIEGTVQSASMIYRFETKSETKIPLEKLKADGQAVKPLFAELVELAVLVEANN